MNIDLGSFAYGSTLENGVGTPAWGTSLGQSRPEYYITREGSEEVVMGMVYCSVPLDKVSLPLGRGGRVCNCLEAETIQLSSVFNKVFVNGESIQYPFIMVLQKEDSNSHSGRRGIKYTDKAIYEYQDGRFYSNSDFVNHVYQKFGLSEDACWFVYDISVKNYDELHLKAIFVNKDGSEEYFDSHSRSEEWTALIEEAGDEYKERYISAKVTTPETTSPEFRPYITAIKSKPFLLLAGISGTGKSRIVRQLAKSCWDPSTDDGKKQRNEHKPCNYELIQVKPNWHDSSELIGFESRLGGGRFIVGPFLKFLVKAMQDPKKPYFLCLDEMNLAPVEQYFAEYLSVLETRKLKDGKIITDPIIEASIFNKKYAENYNIFEELGLKKINRTVPQEALINNTSEMSFDEYDRQDIVDIIKEEGLRIPQNLIVVGTVNMDETTYGFSRKVLDRAMTIEMNEVDLKAGLDEESMEMPYIKEECFIPDCVEGKDVYSDYTTECNDALEYLELINKELDNSPFKIAYRTRNEFLVYIVNALRLAPDTEDKNYVIAKALDEITCMKILSRIEGDKRRVGDRISKDHLQKVVNDMKAKFTEKIEKEEKRKQLEEYQLISVAKLEHMQDKLNSGYTDFWD